jgi:hypothetical protein
MVLLLRQQLCQAQLEQPQRLVLTIIMVMAQQSM